MRRYANHCLDLMTDPKTVQTNCGQTLTLPKQHSSDNSNTWCMQSDAAEGRQAVRTIKTTCSRSTVSVAALIPAFLGLWLDRRYRSSISEDQFRKLFFVGLLIIGCSLLLRAVWNLAAGGDFDSRSNMVWVRFSISLSDARVRSQTAGFCSSERMPVPPPKAEASSRHLNRQRRAMNDHSPSPFNGLSRMTIPGALNMR